MTNSSPVTEQDGTFTGVVIKRMGVLIDTADKSSRWEMEARAAMMSATHLLKQPDAPAQCSAATVEAAAASLDKLNALLDAQKYENDVLTVAQIRRAIAPSPEFGTDTECDFCRGTGRVNVSPYASVAQSKFTPGDPVEIRKVGDAIDEIVIRRGDVHIEQMSADSWFMGVEASDGSYWQFWFGAKNRKSHVEFRHTEHHHPAVADFTKPASSISSTHRAEGGSDAL